MKKSGFGRKQASQANAGAKRYNSVDNPADSDVIILPKYQEAVILEAKFSQYALNPDKDANKAKVLTAWVIEELECQADVISIDTSAFLLCRFSLLDNFIRKYAGHPDREVRHDLLMQRAYQGRVRVDCDT